MENEKEIETENWWYIRIKEQKMTKGQFDFSADSINLGRKKKVKKQKVLILGGFGFIGKNLIERLVKTKDWEICIVDRLDREQINSEIISCLRSNNILERKIDISIENNMQILLSEKTPDIVINLAANANPLKSFDWNDTEFNNNLSIVDNLLYFLQYKEHNIKQVFHFSSSMVIPDGFTGLEEEVVMDPKSPYAFTKVVSENAIKYFNNIKRKDNAKICVVRPFTNYGKYCRDDMFFSQIIKKTIKGEDLRIYPAMRDFINVKDTVMILETLMRQEPQDRIINIGIGDSMAVSEFARCVRNCIPTECLRSYDSSGSLEDNVRENEVKRTIANVSKLNAMEIFPVFPNSRNEMKKAVVDFINTSDFKKGE